jgi:hypothetical protein
VYDIHIKDVIVFFVVLYSHTHTHTHTREGGGANPAKNSTILYITVTSTKLIDFTTTGDGGGE